MGPLNIIHHQRMEAHGHAFHLSGSISGQEEAGRMIVEVLKPL